MTSTIVAPPLAENTLGSGTGDFVIAEWRDGGGPPCGERRRIAPPHVHPHEDQAWYVLEGALCIQMGEEVVEARAASGALVSRGTPHAYRNPGPGPRRYLLIMTASIYQWIQDDSRHSCDG